MRGSLQWPGCRFDAYMIATHKWSIGQFSRRFIFHAQPVGYWPITLHFGFHGCHHKFPMDKERLVFPPLPAFAVASVIYALLAAALPEVFT